MFKAVRRYYWLTQKFIGRHYRVMLRTLGIVLSLSLVVILTARYLPATRQVQRIGVIGKYTPETLPTTIQQRVSTGLVTIDGRGNAQPGLADSWTVDGDGKIYTFQLKDSIVWHDKSSLVPSDIIYNFREVKTSYGEGTVIFELQEPFAPFLNAVSKPIFKRNSIGTGEYMVQKSKVYSGVLQEMTLLSEKDKLVFKFYPTESSAQTAFKLGEIDQIENLSQIPSDLQTDPAIQITENSDSSRLVVLFFNNNDSTLNSKPARQGLAYAIRDKAFGRSRSLSPIDNKSWAYNPLVKEYDFDESRAKTLFFTDVQAENPPSFELKTTLNYLDVAEKIAEDWRQVLGLKVDVKVVTNIGSDYQILLTDFVPPTDPDQYAIWHSTQSTNFTHYSNLKVDKLLEDGRRTLDQRLRADIYKDFQRFLLEDSPAVFLFHSSGVTLSRKPLSFLSRN